MVSITIPRFPSILSPFLGSQDTAAYTSASIERSAMSLPTNLHAGDGMFVLIYLLRLWWQRTWLFLFTLAWMNFLDKKTLSKKGLMYICLSLLLWLPVGPLFAALPRDLWVHAGCTKRLLNNALKTGSLKYPGDKETSFEEIHSQASIDCETSIQTSISSGPRLTRVEGDEWESWWDQARHLPRAVRRVSETVTLIG